MRVLVSARKRDERGAVAILVALLMVSLCIVSAFVIDLGAAYTSKRQLQTSSDAAALAAAAVYAQEGGTCAELAADGDLLTAAEAAADDYRDRNEIDSLQDGVTGEITDVVCADGLLQVSYESTGDTSTFFGPLAGAGDSITTSRAATAILEAPTSIGSGLRPLALCTSTIPNDLPSQVVKVSGPGVGADPLPEGCPEAANPGNWWSIKCPESTNNGGLADDILNGCQDPVSIVPGQEGHSPATLGDYLRGQCPQRSSSCLEANPGNLSQPVASAFSQLIDNETRVVLPVFCGSPRCNPKGVSDDPGQNEIYPVHRLVGVTICGYRFNNITDDVEYLDDTYQGICRTNNTDPPLTSENAGEKKENYLLVVFHTVQVSGTTEPSDCELGSECDSGLRRARLID